MNRIIRLAGPILLCMLFVTPIVGVANSAPSETAEIVTSPHEQEVLRLKRDLKQSQHFINYFQERLNGASDIAFQAPFGRFLLIKKGNVGLAFQITEHFGQGGTGSKYRWFLQKDGTFDFTRTNVLRGSGEVSESSEPLPASEIIRAGVVHLSWGNDDWISFDGSTPDIQMTRTEWIRPEDVDIKHLPIPWFGRGAYSKWKPVSVPGPAPGSHIKLYPHEMALLADWMANHGYFPTQYNTDAVFNGPLPDYECFETVLPSLTTLYVTICIAPSGEMSVVSVGGPTMLPGEGPGIDARYKILVSDISSYCKTIGLHPFPGQ